jgi:uncharacterized protein YecE (DUF72 family)
MEADAMSGHLRIGTSGWNYPAGRGTWNGLFYPTRRPRGFDELSYYAEHFDTVEVNSTFYGEPKESVSRTWVKRTPPGFEFSLKLHQKFTHPKMYAESARVAARVSEPLPKALIMPSQADIDSFRRGMDPIASSGRLGALLAQFPPSFKDSPENRDYLAWLLRAFSEYPVAVELRHRTWSDHIADTLTLLNTYQAALTQIDEPKFRFSIRQNLLPNVQGFYYLRLHGRNAAAWWRHERTEDRYDYLYSAAELKPYAETAVAVRQLVKKMHLYLNNHFAAKSVANAVMIKNQLGEPIEGEYPPEFVERYPDLRDAVRSTPTFGQTSLITQSSHRG